MVGDGPIHSISFSVFGYWLREAPFDEGVFNAALASAEEKTPPEIFYSSGGVFQWINHLWSPAPGVKVSERVVDEIVERDFKHGPPKFFKISLMVAVMASEGAAMDPNAILEGRRKGAMLSLSPCEFAHAAIFACGRDIEAQKGDAVLREWRHVFRTVQMDFVRASTGKASLHAFQLREDYLARGEQVAWTTIQRVQLVIREKAALEFAGTKCSSAKLAAVFASGVSLAKSSEPMSPSFIDAALTIEARVLSNDVCSVCLTLLEDHYGISGPFNSVYKLQSVVNRGKTQQGIEWCLLSLADALRMRFLEVGDFTVSKLNTALCDLAVLKLEFRNHFLIKFLDEHAFSQKSKHVVRSVLGDHLSVRKNLTGFPGEKNPDLSWQISYSQSTIALMDLIEAPTSLNN